MAHHLTPDHLSVVAQRSQNQERNKIEIDRASRVAKSSVRQAKEGIAGAALRIKRQTLPIS